MAGACRSGAVRRGGFWIVIVGMGASLGREGAPQLTGAAVATVFSEWAKLPVWQRRLLVASGAGAGMAAVYNVPLGGALFAVEVLLGTLSLPVVLPAVAMSAIATVVAWVAVPNRPTYLVPVFGVTAAQIVWALIIGPLAGLVAVGWVRAIAAVNALKPRQWGRALAPVVIFTVLGVVSITYPSFWVTVRTRWRWRSPINSRSGCWPCCWCSSRSRPLPVWGAAPPAGCSHRRSRSGCCSATFSGMGGRRFRRGGGGQLRDHRRGGGARGVDARARFGGRADPRAHAHADGLMVPICWRSPRQRSSPACSVPKRLLRPTDR